MNTPADSDGSAADLTLSLPAEELRLATEVLTPESDAIDWERIEALCAKPDSDLSQLKYALKCGDAAMAQLFLGGDAASRLVTGRARLVDLVVQSAWRAKTTALNDTALVAVGGYGRGELHPHSDIDLLILLPAGDKSVAEDAIAEFLASLWDLGLDIGHSTRTVANCEQDAARDLTIISTLTESRLLAGNTSLYDEMNAAIAPDKMWSSRRFFEAKLKEQQARHLGFDDTAYNLEPDVKSGPGGLRDIQTIFWVARRHFGDGRMTELVDHGFLTPGQLQLLKRGREMLWRIRFALHLLTNRGENRLLFDYQQKIAAMFGYRDATYTLAVEQLMQRYYRTVMDLSRLNEMLLQRFQEEILMNPNVAATPLTTQFQARNGFLQVVDETVFREDPSAMLELFLLLQQHPELNGVAADTITAVKQNLDVIDDEFRQNPRNHDLFLRIICAPEGVTHELRRMNLYGVLGLYIPAFGRIVGRMQYDLFHAYTVDAHTLFVVSNLRRFALERFDHEFPQCSQVMQNLHAPEIAYLAGLFHDIAKGRGGDHSELGAIEAEAFCLEHGMSRSDSGLVAWLVKQHLTLSLTAQKKDIGDPAIIEEFAELVGDERHLNYLYVLTHADVRATNPKLWNSWRKQLFDSLYRLTRQFLRRGRGNPVDIADVVQDRRNEARQLLNDSGMQIAKIESVWANFTDEYFMRCRPEEIASHTRLFASSPPGSTVMVELMEQASQGGTAVFLFSPQEAFAFAASTAVLLEIGLNVADARIIRLHNDLSLTTFIVLEQQGEKITDPARLQEIRRRLKQGLSAESQSPLTVSRRAPRQVRLFDTEVLVSFSTDDTNNRTIMEIVAGDRPGLLSEIAQVLRAQKVSIQTAKVLTIGERAEDVFFITNEQEEPLSEHACEALEVELKKTLSNADD